MIASLRIIATITLLCALSVASDITAPVTLALVTGIVLAPVVDFWERLTSSRAAASLLSLMLTMAILGALGLTLQPIATDLVDKFPKVLADIQHSLRDLQATLRSIDDISGDVAGAIQGGVGATATAPESKGADVPTVADAILVAPAILAQMVIFAGTLFFFLLTRAELYLWVASVWKRVMAGALDVTQLRLAERQVSRYFLTITMINAALAASTASALKIIGLPGALQWGLLAFFINFVVYLGPAVFALSLVFAGIAAFDGAFALAPAAVFLMFNVLEGQFITPALVGREMRINPLLVFLSVTFGLWFWGAIGGIVAIPLMVWLIELTKQSGPAPVTGPE